MSQVQKPQRLLTCLAAILSLSACIAPQKNAVDTSCGLQGVERTFFRIRTSDYERSRFIEITNRANSITALGMPPPFFISRISIGWESATIKMGTMAQMGGAARERSPLFDIASFVAYEGPDTDIVLRRGQELVYCSTNDDYSRIKSCRFDMDNRGGMYLSTVSFRGKDIRRLHEIERKALRVIQTVAKHCGPPSSER